MDIETIKKALCRYDKRNPLFDVQDKKPIHGRCLCSNCFYGRTELADALLKTLDTSGSSCPCCGRIKQGAIREPY